jgi:hypothetical protein
MKKLCSLVVVFAALGPLACDRIGIVDRTPSVSGMGGVAGSGAGASGNNGSGGNASGGNGGASGSGGASAAFASGLPCEVQTVMVKYCASCHGASVAGGAPRSLMTYSDLTRKDLMTPTMTEAEAAMARMQSKSSPMPPAPQPGPSATEMSTVQAWISSGYPTGSCAVESTGGTSGGSSGAGGGANSGGSSGRGGASGSAGTGGASGAGGSSAIADAGVPGGTLPCDVQTLLSKRCTSCHGTTPSGGAPKSLVTYANLTAPDVTDPSKTEAQVALQRMQDTSAPMPPAPASQATNAEIATLQDWIDQGYPSGSCSDDAGTALPDPLNASPTCTSNTTWRNGTRGSASMEPGQACITCHATTGGEAPTFSIAGTLYPTGHEPDNCNGVNGGTTGAKVVVTGSNGNSVTLTPNTAGNFYSTGSLPPPYQAKVVNAQGVERVMSGTASTGDCNSCHTQNGANDAPGRITLP